MSPRLVFFRLLALLGLSLSVALAIDEVLPTPAFCGFQAGCEAVTHSQFGRVLGVPLSAIGAAAFALFFALTLSSHRLAEHISGSAALAAGIAGMTLIGLQLLVLRRTCPFCLAIDAAAMLLAVIALMWPARPEATNGSLSERSGISRAAWASWVAAGVLAVAGPLIWAAARPAPELPDAVRALQTAGSQNLVEITDFACPHCRRTHPAVREFLRRHPEVHFVRVVAPLKTHPQSRPAARAYLCAVRQGRGAALAEALFAADELSPAAVREAAAEAGLDLARYDADLVDEALNRTLDETLAWVEATGVGGLPQLWLDDLPLLGRQSLEGLEAAFARVQRRTSAGRTETR